MIEMATTESVCVCVNQHQSTGQLFNIVCGITNRSHCVTFVNMTLSPILSYTRGLPVLPLFSFSLLSHSNLCGLPRVFPQQIMTRSAWRRAGAGPTRRPHWSGSDVDAALVRKLWWMTRWTVCPVRVWSCYRFVFPLLSVELMVIHRHQLCSNIAVSVLSYLQWSMHQSKGLSG